MLHLEQGRFLWVLIIFEDDIAPGGIQMLLDPQKTLFQGCGM